MMNALEVLMFVLRLMIAPLAAISGHDTPTVSVWIDYTSSDGAGFCEHRDLIACIGTACYDTGVRPCGKP